MKGSYIFAGIIYPACLLAAIMAAPAAPVELLKGGGFEEATNGVPAGWRVGNAGELKSVADQRSGKLAAKFTTRQHEWGYCFFVTVPERLIPVKTGAVYRASIWAKGEGACDFLFPQSTRSGTFIGSLFGSSGETGAAHQLVPEWRRYEYACIVTNSRVANIAFGVRLAGREAQACFDDASFTFDPAENPGVAIEAEVPRICLPLEVRTRAAAARVFVDGKEIPQDRDISAMLGEGLHCIGVSAVAAGTRPGVRVRIPGHPETDGRWRIGLTNESGWMEAAFNDHAWPKAAGAVDGFIWSTNSPAPRVFLRQVILWNATHHGPQACINPPIREWGFSEDSLESLFLALSSPLPFALADYEFVLDVPECFRLLDKTNYITRHVMNQKCASVRQETVRHAGQVYTRYCLAYPVEDVQAGRARCSVIPLRLSKYSPCDAGIMARVLRGLRGLLRPANGNACRFYFHRRARGNFTELEQTIPVRILPPINGRRPERVMISQYCAVPWSFSRLGMDHLKMHIEQSLRAGFNCWSVCSSPGWGDAWQAYVRFIHDEVVSGGGRIFLVPPASYPLYGPSVEGHTSDALFQWVSATAGARARYFRDDPQWNSPGVKSDMYCPSFVTSEGAAAFREIVCREYRKMLAAFPGAALIWTDWESQVWQPGNGKGSWCFCERCKQAFRRFARIPESVELSDAAIQKDYRVQWAEFRSGLDGQIQGELRKVCRELGKSYMVYSWGHPYPFWPACKGRIDFAFLGMPGNSVANGSYQKTLDDAMQYQREAVGLARVMGQRFSFFAFDWRAELNSPAPKFQVLSDDGYLHPKSWKSQILRIAAAVHGGVDLQCSLECAGGMQYYIGEATRIIARYESLFWEGERADHLASSDQIQYPNLLVLRKGPERLVLLFNEGKCSLKVNLRNKELLPGQTATVFASSLKAQQPGAITITIPPEDVAAVHIQ